MFNCLTCFVEELFLKILNRALNQKLTMFSIDLEQNPEFENQIKLSKKPHKNFLNSNKVFRNLHLKAIPMSTRTDWFI